MSKIILFSGVAGCGKDEAIKAPTFFGLSLGS